MKKYPNIWFGHVKRGTAVPFISFVSFGAVKIINSLRMYSYSLGIKTKRLALHARVPHYEVNNNGGVADREAGKRFLFLIFGGTLR